MLASLNNRRCSFKREPPECALGGFQKFALPLHPLSSAIVIGCCLLVCRDRIFLPARSSSSSSLHPRHLRSHPSLRGHHLFPLPLARGFFSIFGQITHHNNDLTPHSRSHSCCAAHFTSYASEIIFFKISGRAHTLSI